MALKHTIEEIVLDNGARGIIVYVPDATVVSYDINFRAGNQYSPSVAKQQVAHVMEHMVFGATKSITSSEEFSRQFTKHGAYYNAVTYQRNMTYEAEAPLMDWERILELQKLAICEPLFTEEILKTEKRNVLEELTGQEDANYRLLWQRIYRDMGGPLLTDTEKKATVDGITLKDVMAHHKRTHTTDNMRFCIVGDFAQHREKIISIFEEWPLPRGKELAVIPQHLHNAKPRRIYRKEATSNEFAFHVVLNREFSIQEIIAMNRLSHILTGTFHSRLFGAARTRGLVYGLYTGFDTNIEGITRWETSGQVTTKNALPLYELVAEQMKKIANGDISQQELDDAKLYAFGDYQFKGQRVSDLSRWYSTDYFDDLIIDRIDIFPDYIEKVDLETIARLAKEFLDNGKWGIGMVGTMSASELNAVQKQLAPLFSSEVE